MNNIFTRGIEVVGSVLIENDNKEIFLAMSPKWNNKWVLPGGHVEPGETLLDSQVREGEEETGLKLKGIKIFHYGELINSTDFHRPVHFIFFDIYAKVIGGEVNIDTTELTEYKWVKPYEALNMDLAETYREVIEKFIELSS